MTDTPNRWAGSGVSFSLDELTGALGDSVTVLPLIVALAVATDVSLPHVLVAFGIFQVVWGIRYGIPISVEPMKALIALVIVGTLSYADMVVAGLLIGVLLLVLGHARTLSWLGTRLGEPVVRGIQLAVALLLVETGATLVAGDPGLAAVGLLIAGLFIVSGRGTMSTVAVLGVGCGLAVAAVGLPMPQLPGLPPLPDLRTVSAGATVEGTAAQMAMTIGNAAVATSLLISDYFDREISPDELGKSMGVMTLAALPIGGIPMCHGSGGLAGKVAFGARTGGANVILGILYVLVALVATTALIAAFPLAMLGVLLVLVAVELGRSALRTEGLGLTLGIGVLGVLVNVGIAFVAGVVAWWILDRYGHR